MMLDTMEKDSKISENDKQSTAESQESAVTREVPVIPNAALFNRTTHRRSKCPLSAVPESEIEYKNIDLLKQFTSERGRILPSRLTGVTAKKQRLLRNAIHRARHIGLMPYMQQ